MDARNGQGRNKLLSRSRSHRPIPLFHIGGIERRPHPHHPSPYATGEDTLLQQPGMWEVALELNEGVAPKGTDRAAAAVEVNGSAPGTAACRRRLGKRCSGMLNVVIKPGPRTGKNGIDEAAKLGGEKQKQFLLLPYTCSNRPSGLRVMGDTASGQQSSDRDFALRLKPFMRHRTTGGHHHRARQGQLLLY